MRIIYVCRLYSGFEESLQNKVWDPKGAPTIAKMIEALDAKDFTLVLTEKTYNKNDFPNEIEIDGLKTTVKVLKGPSSLPRFLWKFRDKLNDIIQLWTIFSIVRSYKPDIVYCDRVNILPAAMLSRFTKNRVIWRVMGVLGIMHHAKDDKSFRAAFSRWMWRSPFSAVICTRDGSDGEPWLKAVLSNDVPYYMMLNGIDFNLEPKSVELPQGKKALFVGRLEPMKGAEEFLDAVAAISKIQAVIVGDGSLLPALKALARKLDIQHRTHFLGALSPAQLKYIRQNSDFYVSLNTHGNLANVNLEALSDHLPTIVPKATHKIDKDTEQLIPQDVFYRFGKVGDKNALVQAMQLFCNTDTCIKYRNAAATKAGTIVSSWEKRVSDELDIYHSLQPCDVTLIISDLGSGGAQKVAVSLLNELRDQGKKLSVITLTSKETDFHKLPSDIERISLERYTLYYGIKANIGRIVGLRRALKQLRSRQVISFIGPTNVIAVWACLGLGSTLTISERNDPSRQSFGYFWDMLRILSYRFATHVTANSENALKTLNKYVPKRKLYYVPNGLSKPPNYKDKKEKSILIVGRLHPQKNHQTLISAFAQVQKSFPDWKLIIAGDGQLMEQLKAQVRSLALDDFVSFEGKISNPYQFFAKASVFVLPSLHEGTPNALLESMSCGVTPIISDACNGAFPYVVHGKSGLITPVNDTDKLAGSLSKLMSNPDYCAELGNEAAKMVSPLFEKSTTELWSEVLVD